MEANLLQMTYAEWVAAIKYVVYIPACLLCAGLLLPRLSTFSRRLAGGALMIKLVLLLLSLELASERSFTGFVWNFDMEHNIPSQLGATLMSYAGMVALLAAWRAGGRSKWRRVHFLAAACLLLLLAIDDYYYPLKSFFELQTVNYHHEFFLVIGLAFGGATVAAFAHDSGRMRLWHGCLLAGCALIALGAILLDSGGEFCGLPFLVKIVGGCKLPIHIEELAEQMGSWLAVAATLGYLDQVLPDPSRRLRCALILLPLLWLPIILLMSQVPRLELAGLSQRAETRFGHGIQLLGYDIDHEERAIGLRFYLSASQAGYVELANNFIDLVDGVSGMPLATAFDHSTNEQGVWFLGADHELIYRQRLRLPITADLPANHALWITLAMANHSALMHIEASDLRTLGKTHAVLEEFVILSPQPPPDTAPIASFDGKFALMDVALPARAQAGDALAIPITWRSNADSREDYSQFLHFVHVESGAQWGYDQPPLGLRLPTRLWYAGLTDTETWQVTLPPDLAQGQYDVFSGLYNSRDLQRLPATDPAGALYLDARVSLGSLTIDSGQS